MPTRREILLAVAAISTLWGRSFAGDDEATSSENNEIDYFSGFTFDDDGWFMR